MIPIEIVNKILEYVSEINNDVIITQYHIVTNKEYYKINFNSDFLWKIKTNLILKRIYPIHSCDFFTKRSLEFYKSGMLHYEKQLRIKK